MACSSSELCVEPIKEYFPHKTVTFMNAYCIYKIILYYIPESSPSTGSLRRSSPDFNSSLYSTDAFVYATPYFRDLPTWPRVLPVRSWLSSLRKTVKPRKPSLLL